MTSPIERLASEGYVEMDGVWTHRDRPYQLMSPSVISAIRELSLPTRPNTDDSILFHELLSREPLNEFEQDHKQTLLLAVELLTGERQLPESDLLRTRKERHERRIAAMETSRFYLDDVERKISAKEADLRRDASVVDPGENHDSPEDHEAPIKTSVQTTSTQIQDETPVETPPIEIQ